MLTTDEDAVTPSRQLALGTLVLGITCLLANLGSFRVSPGEAIADRLADHLVGRLSVVGYWAQLAVGVWLAMALILDVAWGRRWAPVLWLVALCLYLAPLPSLTADLALDPALLVIGTGIAVFGRALLAST